MALSLANVPRHASLEVQRDSDALRPSAITLIDDASRRLDVAAVLYRPPPNYDLYGVPLLARVQSDGIEFFVDDEVLVRQFVDRRGYHGQLLPELRVVTAMDAIDAESDPNVIAFVSALSVGDRAALQSATLDVEAWLFDGGITLSAAGRSAGRGRLRRAVAEPARRSRDRWDHGQPLERSGGFDPIGAPRRRACHPHCAPSIRNLAPGCGDVDRRGAARSRRPSRRRTEP